jgi:hypothetical protein
MGCTIWTPQPQARRYACEIFASLSKQSSTNICQSARPWRCPVPCGEDADFGTRRGCTPIGPRIVAYLCINSLPHQNCQPQHAQPMGKISTPRAKVAWKHLGNKSALSKSNHYAPQRLNRPAAGSGQSLLISTSEVCRCPPSSQAIAPAYSAACC